MKKGMCLLHFYFVTIASFCPPVSILSSMKRIRIKRRIKWRIKWRNIMTCLLLLWSYFSKRLHLTLLWSPTAPPLTWIINCIIFPFPLSLRFLKTLSLWLRSYQTHRWSSSSQSKSISDQLFLTWHNPYITKNHIAGKSVMAPLPLSFLFLSEIAQEPVCSVFDFRSCIYISPGDRCICVYICMYMYMNI